MRYSIFSILKITTCCAALLGLARLIWSWEPQAILAVPFLSVIFAFLGAFALPLIFVPMAIIFASQKGSQLDPKSVPIAVFLFRLWILDLAIIALFALCVCMFSI